VLELSSALESKYFGLKPCLVLSLLSSKRNLLEWSNTVRSHEYLLLNKTSCFITENAKTREDGLHGNSWTTFMKKAVTFDFVMNFEVWNKSKI